MKNENDEGRLNIHQLNLRGCIYIFRVSMTLTDASFLE